MKTNRIHVIKKNQWQGVIGILAYLLISTLWTSCSEDIAPELPGNGQEGYVNFFQAAEALYALHQEEGFRGVPSMIYVNDSLPRGTFPNSRQFPRFVDYSGGNYSIQFPARINGAEIVNLPSPYPIGGGVANFVYWMPLAADGYRFIFAARKEYIQESETVAIAPKTFHSLYVAESPENDHSYAVVHVPVRREGVPGKVLVQLVNLVTDWDGLDAYFTDENNEPVKPYLSERLPFGGYSPYIELDIASFNGRERSIFFSRQGRDDARVMVNIPPTDGGNYTAVVHGFEAAATRRLKVSGTEYRTVDILPNLRVTCRRVW